MRSNKCLNCRDQNNKKIFFYWNLDSILVPTNIIRSFKWWGDCGLHIRVVSLFKRKESLIKLTNQHLFQARIFFLIASDKPMHKKHIDKIRFQYAKCWTIMLFNTVTTLPWFQICLDNQKCSSSLFQTIKSLKKIG